MIPYHEYRDKGGGLTPIQYNTVIDYESSDPAEYRLALRVLNEGVREIQLQPFIDDTSVIDMSVKILGGLGDLVRKNVEDTGPDSLYVLIESYMLMGKDTAKIDTAILENLEW